MNEILELHRVHSYPPSVELVDGFLGMDAVTQYLLNNPDHDNHYYVTDIGDNIRAVALFTADNLLLVTSGGEVTRDACQGCGR